MDKQQLLQILEKKIGEIVLSLGEGATGTDYTSVNRLLNELADMIISLVE